MYIFYTKSKVISGDRQLFKNAHYLQMFIQGYITKNVQMFCTVWKTQQYKAIVTMHRISGKRKFFIMA